MNATVKLFFETLSQKLPDYKKHLNPPCDPEKFAEIETLIGEQLPEAMRDFYGVTDGEPNGYNQNTKLAELAEIQPLRLALGSRFMSLLEIENEYSWCANLVEDEEDYVFTGDSEEMPFNGSLMKPVFFHRKWLPIVNDDGGGNYFAIDFAPEQKGTKGQIILHSTSGDEGAFFDLATSFEDLLKQITKYMHENMFNFEEDDSRFSLEFNFRENCYYTLPITQKQEQILASLTPKWKGYFASKPANENIVLSHQWTQLFTTAKRLTNDIIENDLSPLLLCPKLKTVSLLEEKNNYSIDILPELLQLISLGINGINQKDIEIIGNISSLWALNISTKNATDLSALAKLSNLHILTISSDRKIDFSHFIGLNELRTLSINSPEKLDLTPLQYLPKLSSLGNFTYNDLSVLLPLKQLKHLALIRIPNYVQPDYSRSYYENWETIKELKNLTNLDVCNSNFTDLSIVVDLPKLEVLNIIQCEIADFSLLTSIKQKMFLNITLDQFFEAHSYIDKEKITLPYIQTSGRTDEEKAFLEKWFAK